jgi:hypothetical protein
MIPGQHRDAWLSLAMLDRTAAHHVRHEWSGRTDRLVFLALSEAHRINVEHRNIEMSAKEEAEKALRDFHALCRSDISQAARDALFRVGKYLASIKEAQSRDDTQTIG